MAEASYRDWPFFEARHRDFAARLEEWAGANIDATPHAHHDVDAECHALVRKLGDGGWLAHLPAGRV